MPYKAFKGSFSQIAPLFIIFIVFISFLPSLDNDFVNWDDEINICNNPYLRPVTIDNLIHLWTYSYKNLYIPLIYTSFAIDTIVWGNAPSGYHLTNILIHITSAIVIYYLLRLLFSNTLAAIGGSLIFAIHPVQVEAVTWITGRKDLLSGLLSLITIWQYMCWSKTQHFVRYILSLLVFILALLAKPTVVIIPLMIFVIEYVIMAKQPKRILLSLWPWIIISIAFAWLTVYYVQTDVENIIFCWQRIFIACDAIVFYLRKLLIPIPLLPVYGRTPGNILNQWWTYLLPAIPIFLAVLVIRHRAKLFILAGALFIIGLLPVLGLVSFNFQEYSTTADRYLYLPMIAVAVAIAHGYLLWRKYLLPRHIVFIIVYIFVISVFGVLTWRQTKVWKDSITLWSYTLAHNPYCLAAYNNRSMAYAQQGKYDHVVSDLTQAIRINPDYALAYESRGFIYNFKGNYDRAISDYSKAINIDTNYTLAYYDRGKSYVNKGDYEHAIADFTKVIKSNPNYAKAYNDRGLVYSHKKNHNRAIIDYTQAISLNPNYANAYNNRGSAYVDKGNYSKAISDYNYAIAINPNFAEAHYNRAVAYFYKQSYEKSWEDVHRAEVLGMKVDPKFLEKLQEVSGRRD